MARYSMLKRAPATAEVFVVGVKSADDLKGLLEASSIASQFNRVIVAAPGELDLAPLQQSTSSIVHWRVNWDSLTAFLREASRTSKSEAVRILTKVHGEIHSVDVSSKIDQSHPITQNFEVITADDLLSSRTVTNDDLLAFLRDPTASWLPYAARLPYPRHLEYFRTLNRLLKRFDQEGASLTGTAWIKAQDGSGATTALRQTCFDIAREGFPVILARPSAHNFDFQQIAHFLVGATKHQGEE
jgi:hypothetical protein